MPIYHQQTVVLWRRPFKVIMSGPVRNKIQLQVWQNSLKMQPFTGFINILHQYWPSEKWKLFTISIRILDTWTISNKLNWVADPSRPNSTRSIYLLLITLHCCNFCTNHAFHLLSSKCLGLAWRFKDFL